MYNRNKEPYKIETNSRIAQLVFASVPVIIFKQYQSFHLLFNEKTRGEGGFGSTGT